MPDDFRPEAVAAERGGSSGLAGLRQLADVIGARRITAIAFLMILSSMTEGIGLILLVPVTRIVSGGGGGDLDIPWLAGLERMPISIVLGAIVLLVSMRAYLVYKVLEAQRDLGLNLTSRLRIMGQDAILNAEWRWLSRQNSADHSALIVTETSRIGTLANQTLALVTGAVTFIALVAASLAVSWSTTLVALTAGAAMVGIIGLLRQHRDRDADDYAAAWTRLQRHVSNGLLHLRAARIAGAERQLSKDFDETAETLYRLESRYYAAHARAHLLFQIGAVFVLAILIVITVRVLQTPLIVLVPVLAICARLVPVIGNIQAGLQSWRFCRPALQSLMALVDDARAHAEPAAGVGMVPHLACTIDIKGVRLLYEGRSRPVFDGLNVSIPARCIVGIAGPSGIGKSSLADMLGGLVVPDAGEIAIDGVQLDGENRIRWRTRVAYVEQSPFFLDGTIAQNIAWGVPRPDRALIEQAVSAASADFVFALSDGLDTMMGEAGRQFSGGERQRIALARALLRKPDLLILDEVTSALDDANEAAISQSIRALRGSCTVLILGHRAALLELADEIVDLGTLLNEM